MSQHATELQHAAFPISLAINFLLLCFLLWKFARKPLSQAISDKHAHVADQIEKAAALEREAMTMLQTYKSKLDQLDVEIAELKAEAKRQAHREREELLSRAQKSADQLVADTQLRIQQELEKAKLSAKREWIAEAVERAKAQLKSQSSENNHKKFIEYFFNSTGDATHGKVI